MAALTAAMDRSRPIVKGIITPGNRTVRLTGSIGNVDKRLLFSIGTYLLALLGVQIIIPT
jgi:hypothetical protein